MNLRKIAAVMSEEWREPFSASMEDLGCETIFLPPDVTEGSTDVLTGVIAVVVELSGYVPLALIHHCQALGVPVAGLPVSPESETYASKWGIDVLLSGLAVAREWVSQFSGAPSRGPIVVFWGAAGSPGRSTLAVNFATASSENTTTTLIDCDLEAPALAETFSLARESSGLLHLLRCARVETPDPIACSASMVSVFPTNPRLTLVSGIYDPSVLTSVESASTSAALCTLAELGIALAVDLRVSPHHSWDSPQAKLESEVLKTADRVFAVVSETDLGVIRFAREWSRVEGLVSGRSITVLLRPDQAKSAQNREEYRSAVWELTGISDIRRLPFAFRFEGNYRRPASNHNTSVEQELVRELGIRPTVAPQLSKARWTRFSDRLIGKTRQSTSQ